MENRNICAYLLTFFFILFGSVSFAQSQSKGISFQGVIKTPSGQFPTISGTSVLVKILSPNDCLLREESFSGVNISNGYLNLVIGRGTPTSNNPDPARDLKSVMSNSVNLSGLVCLSPDGSVNSVKTTYEPQTGDVRKLRISMQIDQDNVVADFNMRSVAYAINAESLNGKNENNFLNINSVDGLTQANAESIFQRYTQLNNILNGSFSGNVTGNVSGTAANVTGVVDLVNGGTGASSAAGARTSLGLKALALIDLPSPVDTSKFLRGDGTWASVVGGVSSVSGRAGDVVITTADLADFSSAADARALGQVNVLKGQANGLASLDPGGKVPSTQLALTDADIPNFDASKVNSGTLTVNVNSTSVNAGVGQFTQLNVNDGVGKVVTMTRQAGGADYSIQWPANVGAAGSVLQTDAAGVLNWVTIPSAPVSSVAGRTGVVTLAKEDISGLGTAAELNVGTSPANLVQLDGGAKIPTSLLPNSVLTSASSAGGDLSGTYPNPTVASNAITSVKIADGAVGGLSKVVSTPGSAGTNRLLATDTVTGTTIKDFYCTTIGHYLKWTGTAGFGCAAISSADIADATSSNTPNSVVKRDPSGNISVGSMTGKVIGAVQSTISSKTANYTIQDTDGIITANASGGPLNFTLPSAIGMEGRQFTVKKVDSSPNNITISAFGSQTIDGSATAALSTQWSYMTITSDGANWLVTNSTGANVTASIQFSVGNVVDANMNTLVTSSAVTTFGSGTLNISVTGDGSPQISINGGSWVSSGSLTAGQTLSVRLTSASSVGTTSTATITAGNFSATWTVKTLSVADFTTLGTNTWVVPTGITQVSIETWGAEGASNNGILGGKGAYVKATYSVASGATLYVNVGGQNGTNGGGTSSSGGAGGGASDVRIGGNGLSNRIIVAGGGGGAGGKGADGGSSNFGGTGGDAGQYGGFGGKGQQASDSSYTSAQVGISTSGGAGGVGYYGGGGGGGAGGNGGGGAGETCNYCGNSTRAGGSGGACGTNSSYGGSGGCLGMGGNGAYGGGGGGGYYGGGGGGTGNGSGHAGGGGGGAGSSFVGSGSNTTITGGVRTGNGAVKITY